MGISITNNKRFEATKLTVHSNEVLLAYLPQADISIDQQQKFLNKV